jgi:hypothetical protein
VVAKPAPVQVGPIATKAISSEVETPEPNDLDVQLAREPNVLHVCRMNAVVEGLGEI